MNNKTLFTAQSIPITSKLQAYTSKRFSMQLALITRFSSFEFLNHNRNNFITKQT